MKSFVLLLILLTQLQSVAMAQQTLDWNKLYNKQWRLLRSSIIRPNKPSQGTLVLYSRGQPSYLSLDSRQMYFGNNGTGGGVDAEGNRFSRGWKFDGQRSVWAEGDRSPAEVVKLTDNELILEIKQDYKSPYSNEKEFLIAQDVYTSFDPCTIFESLRSGEWNDPSTWTCQKTPTANDVVQINPNHEVTIPTNYNAYAKSLKQFGKMKYSDNAKLILGQ